MKGHYQKVPDTTRKKTFPTPRVEPNQYKEAIGPHKPSVGERILTAAGDFNRVIAPHLEKGAQMGGKVQRYASTRSRAIDQNFGMGQFNPMTAGHGWMDMSFPGSGFNEPAAPRRKRRKPQQKRNTGWGLY
jgi:hypothetical protein